MVWKCGENFGDGENKVPQNQSQSVHSNPRNGWDKGSISGVAIGVGEPGINLRAVTFSPGEACPPM